MFPARAGGVSGRHDRARNPATGGEVSRMRKIALAFISSLLLAGLAVPSPAGGKFTRLGTDPAGDAPPALDITFLDVGRNKDNLEIRIGIDGMLPVFGGYPEGPGIEWIFTTGKRSFIAEVVASRNPRFFFFELFEDSYEQLQGMTGSYDPSDGFIRMLVPLDLIGARKGTVIAGYKAPLDMTQKGKGDDVDAHMHTAPGQTEYFDRMTTTKHYRLP